MILDATPPTHWKSCTGPFGWYRFWYPPTWTVDDIDTQSRLVLRAGRGTLSLYSIWSPDAASKAAVEDLVPLERLFPIRRNVKAITPLLAAEESVALRGEFAVQEPTSWWRKLWRRYRWQRWSAWAVRVRSVSLIAVYLQDEEPDPEEETLIRIVLKTLRFAEVPADPPEVFAVRVQELARRKFPLLNCEMQESFQLKLGESSINLFNFYRAYLNAPDRFEEMVLPALATVVQVQEWGDAQTQPPLDSVADRIMPMLYPEAVWRESFPNFAGTPWIADLMILYVVDESNAYWYIADKLLQHWDLTREELHEIALRNLDAYFDEHAMEMMLAGEEDGPRLVMPSQADAYNTSRFLSPAFQAKLREFLGREFAVGLPNRDFFVATSLESPDAIEQIRCKIADDYSQRDHPLSERLLFVTMDGVSEFP